MIPQLPRSSLCEILAEQLAETNKRIWILEAQLGCFLNFFRSTFSKEDGDMLEAYIKNELSEEPLEIPEDPKSRLAVLRLIVKNEGKV